MFQELVFIHTVVGTTLIYTREPKKVPGAID